MQFFKPENYFMVREALQKAGRQDLIGSGCDRLIPANPPKEAMRTRMEKANESLGEDKYVHQIPAQNSAGYRPGRKTHQRRKKR
jgi:hypothetical protein